MKNGTEKYIETVAYLGKLYDFANAELFGGELVKPVITVQTDERNKTNGWWSLGKVWKENGEDDGEHELNMTAQQLHRPINEIAATLIHEMCHQYATAHEMKDTSRSGNYHNKLFKKIAETHGLNVECVPKIGWSHTTLTDETGGKNNLFYNGKSPYGNISLARCERSNGQNYVHTQIRMPVLWSICQGNKARKYHVLGL